MDKKSRKHVHPTSTKIHAVPPEVVESRREIDRLSELVRVRGSVIRKLQSRLVQLEKAQCGDVGAQDVNVIDAEEAEAQMMAVAAKMERMDEELRNVKAENRFLGGVVEKFRVVHARYQNEMSKRDSALEKAQKEREELVDAVLAGASDVQLLQKRVAEADAAAAFCSAEAARARDEARIMDTDAPSPERRSVGIQCHRKIESKKLRVVQEERNAMEQRWKRARKEVEEQRLQSVQDLKDQREALDQQFQQDLERSEQQWKRRVRRLQAEQEKQARKEETKEEVLPMPKRRKPIGGVLPVKGIERSLEQLERQIEQRMQQMDTSSHLEHTQSMGKVRSLEQAVEVKDTMLSRERERIRAVKEDERRINRIPDVKEDVQVMQTKQTIPPALSLEELDGSVSQWQESVHLAEERTRKAEEEAAACRLHVCRLQRVAEQSAAEEMSVMKSKMYALEKENVVLNGERKALVREHERMMDKERSEMQLHTTEQIEYTRKKQDQEWTHIVMEKEKQWKDKIEILKTQHQQDLQSLRKKEEEHRMLLLEKKDEHWKHLVVEAKAAKDAYWKEKMEEEESRNAALLNERKATWKRQMHDVTEKWENKMKEREEHIRETTQQVLLRRDKEIQQVQQKHKETERLLSDLVKEQTLCAEHAEEEVKRLKRLIIQKEESVLDEMKKLKQQYREEKNTMEQIHQRKQEERKVRFEKKVQKMNTALHDAMESEERKRLALSTSNEEALLRIKAEHHLDVQKRVQELNSAFARKMQEEKSRAQSEMDQLEEEWRQRRNGMEKEKELEYRKQLQAAKTTFQKREEQMKDDMGKEALDRERRIRLQWRNDVELKEQECEERLEKARHEVAEKKDEEWGRKVGEIVERTKDETAITKDREWERKLHAEERESRRALEKVERERQKELEERKKVNELELKRVKEENEKECQKKLDMQEREWQDQVWLEKRKLKKEKDEEWGRKLKVKEREWETEAVQKERTQMREHAASEREWQNRLEKAVEEAKMQKEEEWKAKIIAEKKEFAEWQKRLKKTVEEAKMQKEEEWKAKVIAELQKAKQEEWIEEGEISSNPEENEWITQELNAVRKQCQHALEQLCASREMEKNTLERAVKARKMCMKVQGQLKEEQKRRQMIEKQVSQDVHQARLELARSVARHIVVQGKSLADALEEGILSKQPFLITSECLLLLQHELRMERKETQQLADERKGDATLCEQATDAALTSAQHAWEHAQLHRHAVDVIHRQSCVMAAMEKETVCARMNQW